MRDDETVHEYVARMKREDDAIGVAAILACLFGLSGVISLVMLLS